MRNFFPFLPQRHRAPNVMVGGGRVHGDSGLCNQQHVALQPAAEGSRVANRH